MLNWHPGLTLDEVEKQVIEQAMRFFEGNKTKTAQALGIAIRTLDARLETYAKLVKTPTEAPKKPLAAHHTAFPYGESNQSFQPKVSDEVKETQPVVNPRTLPRKR